MQRITPVERGAAEGRTRELLNQVEALLGTTPNMTTAMARSSVLDGWLALHGALRGGSISSADGERIALGVAEENGCSYCLSAHNYLGEHVVKLSAEERDRARHFESSDPKSAAILAFAKAVVTLRGSISDADHRASKDAGLSDGELSDIVGHVALNVLTNYFNKAFQTDVDFPVVRPHEHKAAV